mgnify:CR=1 FL=1|tara:strand:- start:218 stop:784 length:567 start_codon:yes stop_codon:yes gene_type:complete
MASNIRALVSNLGDGNWTTIVTDPATTDEFQPNKLTRSSTRCFFPPGVTAAANNVPTAPEKAAAPGVGFCIGGNVNTVGWGSKTNWLFQLKNTAAAGQQGIVQIFGYRPTGVVELIREVAAADIDGGAEFTYGGVDGEEVYGPFVAFKFFIKSFGGTAPVVECYVVGWNYGDVWEVDPSISLTSDEGE